MGDPFSSHPYPGRKQVLPTYHHCEVCEKTIAFKDKAAHERGKKHKQAFAAVYDVQVKSNENTDPNARHNCGQVGHISRECPEPKKAGACFNCGEVGHNKADCPAPVQSKMTGNCFNCGQAGHSKADCTEPRKPRSAEDTDCSNCGQRGHFSRDCPEPKDWSKVICNQCGQSGHTVRRCTAAPMETPDQYNDSMADPTAAAAGGGEDWLNEASGTNGNSDWAATGTTENGGDDWNTTVAAADGGW